MSSIVLLLLVVVCPFAPGFFFVRRFHWAPLEKLVASLGVSLILLYLASAAIYGLRLDWTVASWCVTGACAAMLAISWSDLRRLVSGPGVRRGLYGFGFLWGWTLVMLSIIRHFSGGGWSTDWMEHFERILYFLHRFPVHSQLLEGYAVPARPPMMNLLGAFFLAQSGDLFECYQIVFAYLSLLVFLACYLIAPAAGWKGRRRVVPLVALFAASPVVMQNTTYPWTKLLAAFYVILGIWFYLRGWSKRSAARTTAAFVFLAAGMLVHYSAGPYLLFLALHYLIVVFRKRENRWRELAAVAVAGGLLLATWFVWSFAVYGAHATLASNTSVTPSQKVAGSNAGKIAANFFDTVVPHPLRSDAGTGILEQTSSLGYFRDYLFLIYQSNVIFGIGLLAGPIALYLLYQARRGRKDLRLFWYGLTAFCLIVGVAVHGERETFGVAHVTLQPLILLGLCLVAGSFAAMRRPLAWLVVAGCAIDFLVGVVPQAAVENMENNTGAIVFTGFYLENGKVAFGRSDLSHRAWLNWFGKHQYALSGEWMQQLQSLSSSASPQALVQLRKAFGDNRAHDAALWQGWYSRHEGQMTFIGDHVSADLPGGIDVPMALLAIAFLGTLTLFAREIPRAEPVPMQKKRRRR